MVTKELRAIRSHETNQRKGRKKIGPTAFSTCMRTTLKGKKLKGKKVEDRQKLFKAAVQSCKGRSHKKGSGRGAGTKRKRK